DPAGLAEPLAKRGEHHSVRLGGAAVELANHRHLLLLRAQGARCGRRAAQKEQKFAPLHHSMTSSARASSNGGTVRPSALAVLRLTTSSILLGCSTGRSA